MKMKFRVSTFFLSIACSFIFFIIALVTLKDYGTSWDETLHFSRGQVYLNYFLTGKKEYDQTNPRKSFYQLDYQSGDFFFNDVGHPPLNGIFAALFNRIFYQKLNLFSDIHSYHLFNILVSSFLVFVVVFFAAETLGIFSAIIVFLALTTYPLFFAESHFNVKDPAETFFYTATMFSVYLAFKYKRYKLVLLSGLFFGFGMGIKFNILFLPIIFLIYLTLEYRSRFFSFFKDKKFCISIITAFTIAVTIFFISWPLLWNNIPNGLFDVFKYYEHIGTGTNYQPKEYYFLGFNLFPLLWIVFTTPPVVLVLTLVGLISSLFVRKDFLLLWCLWFIIPILRVSFPSASIYGGSRQIMEFLPAMCLLSAMGGWQIVHLIKRSCLKKIAQFILTCLFIWPIFILVKMHPNQNVYFNSIIGGLSGAKKVNFPSSGNSYGNAYLQGINWINKNAPLGSKVALIQGTETNTPIILFRDDIKLRNAYWSGLGREGEYLMDLTFNDTGKAFYYTWEYVDKFLEPVHEVRVDGVPILKIWKNDLGHTKTEYRDLSENRFRGKVDLSSVDNKLIITLAKAVNILQVKLNFNPEKKCQLLSQTVLDTSLDGINWQRGQDVLPFPQLHNKTNLNGNSLTVYFALREARFIRFLFNSKDSCGLENPEPVIYVKEE